MLVNKTRTGLVITFITNNHTFKPTNVYQHQSQASLDYLLLSFMMNLRITSLPTYELWTLNRKLAIISNVKGVCCAYQYKMLIVP